MGVLLEKKIERQAGKEERQVAGKKEEIREEGK